MSNPFDPSRGGPQPNPFAKPGGQNSGGQNSGGPFHPQGQPPQPYGSPSFGDRRNAFGAASGPTFGSHHRRFGRPHRFRGNNYGPPVPGTETRRGRGMLVFGLVALVGLVLIGCALGLRSQFDSSSVEPPEPAPPATAAAASPSTEHRASATARPTRTPSATPSSRPTRTPSSEPSETATSRPTTAPTTLRSQPDRGGAVPPPAPRTTQVPSGYDVLTDNEMYAAAAQATSCGDSPIRFSGDTRSDLAPLNRYLDCVIPADAEAAGMFEGNVRPKLVPYRGNISSPCGMGGQQNGWTAYYCSANQTIYYDVELAKKFSTEHDPWYPLVLMGHEYGHYVQNQAGILSAGQSTWESDAYLVERRREQQAECLGGVVIGQAGLLPQLDPVWDTWLEQNGGEQTHGSFAARATWMKRGAHADTFASCNTWVVTPSEVAGPN